MGLVHMISHSYGGMGGQEEGMVGKLGANSKQVGAGLM